MQGGSMSAEATYGVGLGLGLDLNKSPPKPELQLQPTVGAPADSTASCNHTPAQPPEPPLQTLAILPAPQPACVANPQVPPAQPSPLQPAPSGNSRQRVKKRGRPPSSTGRKGPKVPATGSGVTGLYPQVIIVQAGEDVAKKIMSFSGNGWAVCIMSAIGAVSNVTVRGSASFSPQTITYEGCFDILSLSDSYLPIERGGLMSTHTRGLSILLACPDGRVLGGGVVGPLTAASPVQVVIGRFRAVEKEELGQAVTSETILGAMNGSQGELGIVPN